jgi:NAD(P)-dependent dehydrogenase (short-subunit alcohol dehydrogenase family)
MPVIAILGAGSGMGLAIGKIFGRHGYRVALLSRNPAKQEPLVTELATPASSQLPFRPTSATAGRSRPDSQR